MIVNPKMVEVECIQEGHDCNGLFRGPLQAWKGNHYPMDKQAQKYRKDALPDQLPQNPEKPTMKICQLTDDGRLNIPTDVRKQFMNCPIYGMEWREIIKKFDADWGAPAPTSTPSRPPSTNGGTPSPGAKSKGGVKLEAKLEDLQPGYDWSKAFPGSPTALADLKAKFPDAAEMAGPVSGSCFILAPDQLYIVAKNAGIHIKSGDGQVIAHGAGGWLQGESCKVRRPSSLRPTTPTVVSRASWSLMSNPVSTRR